MAQTLREIINSVGVDVIAAATQQTPFPVTAEAVKKWRLYGVPTEQMTLVRTLARVRPADILKANDAVLLNPDGHARRRSMLRIRPCGKAAPAASV